MNWKPVRNYEGYYDVSDTGLVRSITRYVPDVSHGRRVVRGKIMQQTEGANGYPVVNLHKFGVSSVIPVHRLVAEAFLDNPHDFPTVNHKDGNKANNSVDNLEWASYSDNNTHALRHNLRSPKSNPVLQIDKNGLVLAAYNSVTDASRQTGISRGMISHAAHGRAKYAGGFVWNLVGKCNDYP